jgi:hypothetical protein
VRKRSALFDCLWYDTQTGRPLHRATAAELAEAHRLWWKHKDLRERLRTESSATPVDDCAEIFEDVVADEWTQIGIDTLGPA